MDFFSSLLIPLAGALALENANLGDISVKADKTSFQTVAVLEEVAADNWDVQVDMIITGPTSASGQAGASGWEARRNQFMQCTDCFDQAFPED